jgi:hypothetical protein
MKGSEQRRHHDVNTPIKNVVEKKEEMKAAEGTNEVNPEMAT